VEATLLGPIFTAWELTVSALVAAPRAIEADLRVTDVLQVTLVNAQGKHVTINEHTDPDYFWAIRGGGGSAWGVRAGCD
jgi:hypothetical protein